LYSAFTQYTGFKVNSGEYKVMGLAPYGEPKYTKIILDKLIDLKDDGTFRLNMEYFNYATGLTMVNKNFEKLFNRPTRNSKNDLLTQFHMDIASSIQNITEEIVLRLAKSLSKQHENSNLCMAGGVALNCVANGKIIEEKIFKNIWVQPAAGDAGGALGSALALWYTELKKERKVESKKDQMQGSYLGPSFNDAEIKRSLDNVGAVYENLSEVDLLNITAKKLSEENIIGWFQGKMEFGPRALGSRSIIADPRSDKMQKKLNLKIKFRESFRPFAPSILKEDLNDWFELECDSPYMLLVADVKKSKRFEMTADEKKLFGIKKLNIKRSDIPAVTHIDYSARIQTVHNETNPKYYNLIKNFKKLTGCPIVVNTSFNVRGEPIVCSIEDAFRCFMGTGLDILVCGNFIMYKEKQNRKLIENYKSKFDLD
jgi:carbamoyltransferase